MTLGQSLPIAPPGEGGRASLSPFQKELAQASLFFTPSPFFFAKEGLKEE